MPQMSPMNWLSLYIFFLIIFMIFIIMNYYSFLYQPKIGIKKMFKNPINWKW